MFACFSVCWPCNFLLLPVAKFVNNFNAFLLCFALLPKRSCLLLYVRTPISRYYVERKENENWGNGIPIQDGLDASSRYGINAKAGKLFRKSLIESHRRAKIFCSTSLHIVQLFIVLVTKKSFISSLLKWISHLQYITS